MPVELASGVVSFGLANLYQVNWSQKSMTTALAKVRVNALGRNASRFFHTRDEADAWGREWLRQRHEAAGNAACSGR